MRPITLQLLLYDERAPGEPVEAMARLVDHAWAPLLDELDRQRHVRLCIRMSGTTLEFIKDKRPAVLEQLLELCLRKQVEVLGGPFFDTPLHIVPWRDAHAQLQAGMRWIRVNLGARPLGSWIPQGAWDPQLPQLLALAGIGYSFLDEGLVRAGSGGQPVAGGWVTAERHGHSIGLFPIDRRLTAMLPMARAPHLMHELRERVQRGMGLVTAAIHIEELGYGARSARWCWEGPRPWIPEFFDLLAHQSAWLKTALPAAIVEGQGPCAQVYPAAGTAPEEAQAILEAEASKAFGNLQRTILEGHGWTIGAAAHLLTGPPWESVLSRYDEANRLHKRMLRSSTAFHRLRRAAKENDTGGLDSVVERARRHLHLGQSIGSLHMGFNGGLADGAVRHTAWRHLLEVERLATQQLDEVRGSRHEVSDHDGDGRKELLLRNKAFAAVLRPAAGGAISELHIWEVGNLVNTLSRRAEAWIEVLEADCSLPALVDDSTDSSGMVEMELEDADYEDSEDLPTDPGFAGAIPEPPRRAVSIDDVSAVLGTDRHRRGLFVDHLFGEGLTLDNLRRGQPPEEGDFVDASYQLLSVESEGEGDVVAIVSREGTWRGGRQLGLLRLAKRVRFSPETSEIVVDYELRNRIHRPVRTQLGVELTLNLDSVPGPHRFIQVDDRAARSPEESFEEEKVSSCTLRYVDHKTTVALHSSRPARLFSYPVRSVLRGRTTYLEAFQGTCLVWVWPVALWGQEKTQFQLRLAVERG